MHTYLHKYTILAYYYCMMRGLQTCLHDMLHAVVVSGEIVAVVLSQQRLQIGDQSLRGAMLANRVNLTEQSYKQKGLKPCIHTSHTGTIESDYR